MSPATYFPPPTTPRGEKISRFVFSRSVMTPAGAFPAQEPKIAPRVWLPPVPAPLPVPSFIFLGQNIPIRGGETQGKWGDFPETLSFAFLCSAGGEIVPGKEFLASGPAATLALESLLGGSLAFIPPGGTGMGFEGFFHPSFYLSCRSCVLCPSQDALAQCPCHIWSLWPHGLNCFWGVKWLGGSQTPLYWYLPY